MGFNINGPSNQPIIQASQNLGKDGGGGGNTGYMNMRNKKKDERKKENEDESVILEEEVDEKYYINTPQAKALIDDLISSGKLNKDVSNTVRQGIEEV